MKRSLIIGIGLLFSLLLTSSVSAYWWNPTDDYYHRYHPRYHNNDDIEVEVDVYNVKVTNRDYVTGKVDFDNVDDSRRRRNFRVTIDVEGEETITFIHEDGGQFWARIPSSAQDESIIQVRVYFQGDEVYNEPIANYEEPERNYRRNNYRYPSSSRSNYNYGQNWYPCRYDDNNICYYTNKVTTYPSRTYYRPYRSYNYYRY